MNILLLVVAATALVVQPVRGRTALSADASGDASDKNRYAVPEGLLIGAGVAAIQVEGAWNEDDKGESAADYVLHLGKVAAMGYKDTTLQDVAANSYHRYKEDVAMAARLKLKVFRFSISWSRVLPTADATKPNAKGVQFYHDLVDEIIKNGMVPFATMFHFDHPKILEDQFHGWQGEEMIGKFKEYARFVFNEYSSKVKLWTTINEPNMYCTYFPAMFRISGMYKAEDIDHNRCIRHAVLAHAEAYRAFKEDKHDGQVGLNILITHARPNSTRPEDVYAADAYNQLYMGQVLNPLVYGDYPELVKEVAARYITPFTDKEKELLRDTVDFVGFNVYFGLAVSYKDPESPKDPANAASPTIQEQLPFVMARTAGVDGNDPQAGFSTITPDALRSAMLWVWQTWKKPLVVTENGMADVVGLGKRDMKRAAYFSAYLRTMVETMKDFKVKVIAYCAWSLIDSFEWSAGFDRPFGLVHVDYEGGTLDRSLKESSQFWLDLADTGVVPYVAASSSSVAASLLVLMFGLLAAIARH